MEVEAKARYIRMSSRKVKLAIDLIRGKSVSDAINILTFHRRLASQPVLKLLRSAVANAVNNFKLKEDILYVKVIKADQGPSLKRWRPRAFGRAAPIKKHACHISIVLENKEDK